MLTHKSHAGAATEKKGPLRWLMSKGRTLQGESAVDLHRYDRRRAPADWPAQCTARNTRCPAGFARSSTGNRLAELEWLKKKDEPWRSPGRKFARLRGAGPDL